jgi:NAD(P)H-dependent FMN reductase
MSEQRLRLVVLIGSVRTGRLGTTVAKWFAEQARQSDQFELSVVDLVEVDLPLVQPDFGAPPPADVLTRLDPFSRQLGEADAFVVVTPEYNHSYPAAVKNAIDWHHAQWQAKPVGCVSYGGISGGLRAVEHLRQVFAEVNAVVVRESVCFIEAWGQWDNEGHWPKNPDIAIAATKSMLDQLAWWARALSEARAKRPYSA